MKPYTFFKHDGARVTPTFDITDCADDIAARAHALKLLAEGPQYHAIEVWDGIATPFTVKRLRLEAVEPEHTSQPSAP